MARPPAVSPLPSAPRVPASGLDRAARTTRGGGLCLAPEKGWAACTPGPEPPACPPGSHHHRCTCSGVVGHPGALTQPPTQIRVSGCDARSGCSFTEHLLCVRCLYARPPLRSPLIPRGAAAMAGDRQVPQVFSPRPWVFQHQASSHRVSRPLHPVTRYVISSLELLVAEDYMIVYLNGATPRRRMPGIGWLKKCYQMIDRRWGPPRGARGRDAELSAGSVPSEGDAGPRLSQLPMVAGHPWLAGASPQSLPASPCGSSLCVSGSHFPSSGHHSSWTGDAPCSRTTSP